PLPDPPDHRRAYHPPGEEHHRPPDEHPEVITQHFPPGYSPELNPMEALNGDTKQHAAARSGPHHRTGPSRPCPSVPTYTATRSNPPLAAALFSKDEIRSTAACEQDI
ncbi:MAG: hypothetical protein ACRDVE_08760, partial [Actinocrinis sp.]